MTDYGLINTLLNNILSAENRQHCKLCLREQCSGESWLDPEVETQLETILGTEVTIPSAKNGFGRQTRN